MIQIRRLSTGAFLGLAIFAAISTAHALSIGRVRGAVLMGRPLNLTLPLVLDADEPEPCIAGDLFHGDTRVSRMSLAQERAPGGGHQIRLTSPVPVDEPIVTLYLRVGCGEKMTRRFVLLAEQEDVAPLSGPATVAVPAQSVDAQASPVAPRVAGTASAAAEPRASTSPRIRPPSSIDAATAPAAPAPRTERAPRAERASRAQASRSPRVDTPAAVASPNLRRENNISRSPRVAPPTSSAEAARSRLRVEPLDLSPVPNTGLRPSLTLSTPTGSPQKRAEALAMWQALNTTPDEFLRQHQRIAAMEAQVKGLRDSMQQNTLAMNQLAQQLEKARGERNTLSLALVALGVVSAVALAAWFWRRRPSRNSSRRWWQDSDRGLSADSVFTPESSSGSHDKPAVTAPVAAGPAQPRATQSPRETVSRSVQLSSLDSRPGSRASSFDSSPSRPPDFAHSQTMSTRMIKAEELIDIQQQAEFFASIGQHDQAAAVLEAHVHDHVETSPAAWMDLLEIYHGLGRRADY
ncbi:MAG: FimV family protein, partial [Vicinamibacterales bacterium]